MTSETSRFGFVWQLWLIALISGLDQLPVVAVYLTSSRNVGTAQRATSCSPMAGGLYGRCDRDLLRGQRNHRQRFASGPSVGDSSLCLLSIFRTPPPLARVLSLGYSPLSLGGHPRRTFRRLQPKGVAHGCAHSTSAPTGES